MFPGTCLNVQASLFSAVQEADQRAWQRQMLEWKQRLGAIGAWSNLKPWTCNPNRRFLGISCSARVMEMLDATCIDILGGAEKTAEILAGPQPARVIESAMRDILIDVSQNPCRRPFSGSDGIARCIHTATALYSFRLDRILLPFELMLLQGHSESLLVPEGMRPKQLHDLAAVGIHLPTLAIIFTALMISVGLRSNPDIHSHSD